MKILLVYPDIYMKEFPYGVGQFHHGIASLSASLKEAGHSVELLHVFRPVRKEEFLSRLCAAAPDLVGFSVSTAMVKYADEWSGWIKQQMNVPIVCGGPHPTTDPEHTSLLAGVDYLCVGEADEAFPQLCEYLEADKDPCALGNFWIRRNGGWIKNPPRPLIENLDSLPFPDTGIFDWENLLFPRIQQAPVMVSRGCPYNCTYCCNHLIKSVYPNKENYVRFRSPKNAVSMIRQIIRDHPATKYIGFADDILFLNKRWFREFAEIYRIRIGLPFRCFGRPNLMDEEAARLLKEAGCTNIYFGVESGSDRIRNTVMRRNINREQIINAFRLCKKYRIDTLSFNIVGLPDETMPEILETVKLNAEIAPTTLAPKIFFPLVKTHLYDYSLQRGYVTEQQVWEQIMQKEGRVSDSNVLTQPQISARQVYFAAHAFGYLVKAYQLAGRLPSPLSSAAIKTMDSLFASPWFANPFLIGLIKARKRAGAWVLPLMQSAAPKLYYGILHRYKRIRSNGKLVGEEV